MVQEMITLLMRPEAIPRRVISFSLSFEDCDCVCHKGGVVIHVAPCCDGYVPGQSRQKPDAKGRDPKGETGSVQSG